MPKKSGKKTAVSLVRIERIEQAILLIRGHKVMLDSDLAELYGVEVRALVQAVKRNIDRFPEDFMLQLTAKEHEALRSQTVTLKAGRGQHRKYLPYAFTQEGVAMLSSVLRSKRAVEVNVAIMRAFVRLRNVLASHKEWAAKFVELEQKVSKHDEAIRSIVTAIRELMEPSVEEPKERMGFKRPKALPKP